MITIEKIDGEKVRLIGRLDLVNFFLESHGINSENVQIEGDNFVSCVMDNEDNFFVEEYYRDYLDDMIFNLAENISLSYEKELDFKKIDHSHIIGDLRYEILSVIDNYIKEVEEVKNPLERAELLTKMKYNGEELFLCKLHHDSSVVVMDAVNLIDTPEIGDVYLGELENDVFYADRIDSE